MNKVRVCVYDPAGTQPTYAPCRSPQVVYALDVKTGELRWHSVLDGRVEATAVAGPRGVVYVGAYDGLLYALSGDDGSRIWTFKTTQSIIVPVALAAGDSGLYVSSFDKAIYKVRGAAVRAGPGLSTTRPLAVLCPAAQPGWRAAVALQDARHPPLAAYGGSRRHCLLRRRHALHLRTRGRRWNSEMGHAAHGPHSCVASHWE